MFSILDDLLKRLPGDGWKTQLGVFLLALPVALPQVVGAAEGVITATGALVTAVGVLHKTVKQIRKKK